MIWPTCIRARSTPFAVAALLAATLCVAQSQLFAEDQPQKVATKSTPIDVTDQAAVAAAMPHEVTISGAVSEVSANNGMLSINFEGTDKSQFNAVVFGRSREAIEKVLGEGLKSLIGKKIRLTGKITLYRDRPQIVVATPEQIVLDAEHSPQKADSHAAPIDATDQAAGLGALPQEATVAGTIADIRDNEGVAMINFNGTEKSQFYAVVLKRNREDVEKVFGEGLKQLAGKRVQLTGKIVEYHEKPEIVISRPEQVTILER
jgi:DNA/RNA endonuclease YhcR with UshA esterase domain